jgi:hypothetical protein
MFPFGEMDAITTDAATVPELARSRRRENCITIHAFLSRQESNSVLSMLFSGADHRSFRRMSRDEAPT